MIDFLSSTGEKYEISINLPEEAGIPRGAELIVEELDSKEYVEKAKDVITNDEVGTTRFFSVKFQKDGETIEPQAPIEVSIHLKDQKLDENTEVVEVTEETADLLENTVEENTATFETENASVYGVCTLRTVAKTVEGKDYTITMSYGADADIPEDAELHAVEVSDKAEMADGTKYVDAAAEKLELEDAGTVKLFDIFLTSGEEKIQPKAPVSVKVELTDRETIAETHVVHFGEEVEELDNEVKEKAVSFETEGFSIFAVVIIDKDEGTFTFEDDDYVVKVSYTKEAHIPYGTELKVEQITPDQDRYWELRKKTIEKLNEGVEWEDHELTSDPRKGITDAAFFNISLIYEGKEIEPDVPLQVKIEYKDDLGIAVPSDEKTEIILSTLSNTASV